MSNPLQKSADNFWNATLFKIIPYSVKPNFFTYLRLIGIPLVLYLIGTAQFGWGLVAFFAIAVTDTIDGSLARVRKQQTTTGSILDPIADKLLIMLMALFLMYYFPFWQLLLAVVLVDILIILESLILVVSYKGQAPPPADFMGKLKMIFRVSGILAVIIYLIGAQIFWFVSVGLCGLAVVFGLISLVTYGIRHYQSVK